MIVARNNVKLVLSGHSGNPDVVLGDGAALGAEIVLDPPVLLRRSRVTTEHRRRGGKLIDPGDVRFDQRRLASAVAP